MGPGRCSPYPKGQGLSFGFGLPETLGAGRRASENSSFSSAQEAGNPMVSMQRTRVSERVLRSLLGWSRSSDMGAADNELTLQGLVQRLEAL
jgi:hypothetical protein